MGGLRRKALGGVPVALHGDNRAAACRGYVHVPVHFPGAVQAAGKLKDTLSFAAVNRKHERNAQSGFPGGGTMLIVSLEDILRRSIPGRGFVNILLFFRQHIRISAAAENAAVFLCKSERSFPHFQR